MATRAVVTVNDEHGESLIHIYQHYDGYDVGETIKKFIDGKEVWNGIPGGKNVPDDGFNGMGSFAAHLINHMVSTTSSIYVVDEPGGCDADYQYIIDYIDGQIRIESV